MLGNAWAVLEKGLRVLGFVTFLVSFLSGESAFAWNATVLNVYDGDTVTVAPAGDENCPLFVRLYGIDAPELGQEGGDNARLWLARELPLKSTVEIIPMGVDNSGRVFGLVARNGRVLNGESVKEGQALVWKGHCQAMVCRTWLAHEKAARDGGKGLWQKNTQALWPKGENGVPGPLPAPLAQPGLQKPAAPQGIPPVTPFGTQKGTLPLWLPVDQIP